MKKLAVLLLALVAGSALAVPLSILSDDWVIPASAKQSFKFTLAHEQKVHLSVYGQQNTAKGFRVALVPDIDGNELTQGFEKDLVLPAGKHILEVINSENILKRATVRVSITAE